MPGRRPEVEKHLRLARGFLATTVIDSAANEFAIRNALSRGYYAVYHVCNAWLAGENVPARRRAKHSELQSEIARHLGTVYGERLKELHAIRKNADYSADWLGSREFRGDLERFRVAAARTLDQMREQFDTYWSKLGGV